MSLDVNAVLTKNDLTDELEFYIKKKSGVRVSFSKWSGGISMIDDKRDVVIAPITDKNKKFIRYTANDLVKLASDFSKMKLENFSIHYPSLKYFSQLAYVDPRVDSKGRRVNFEKEGCFNGQEGHYVMYEDDNLPGKFIAIHVPSSLNEDDDSPGINVVAVDRNGTACANRMKYRMKVEAKKVTDA